MRVLRSGSLSLAVAAALAATAALAHHGAPGYDFSKPLDLEGNIVAVQWKNPHVYFTIDTGTRGSDGKPRVLEIECASPAQVVAFGTQRAVLKPGAHVKVLAFGRIKDPDGANYKGATVTLPDGSVYYLENSQRPALVKETIATQTLAGKWVPASVGNFGEFMVAEAKARGTRGADADVGAKAQAAIDAAGVANVNTCAVLAKDPLPFVTAAVGGLRTIEIGDTRVVMRIDTDGGVLQRVIDLTQTAQPVKIPPTPYGHSIGRWEGGALVIDTAGFAPRQDLLPQSTHKHMVERLTLADDHRHLRYEFTVEDPDYYPTPFHFSMLWTYRPDIEFSGAACDDKVARKYLSIK